MSDLFEGLEPTQGPAQRGLGPAANGPRPLAERLRPARLQEVVGQGHLLGSEGPIGAMLAERRLASVVLWGPPGCGKTTIARLLAGETDLAFEQVSAIFTGVAELRKVFEAARLRHAQGRGTLLFVDEIHRFNKAQQDAFLPQMESGVITLVGATTENPSFELNAALLSRAQVLRLKALTREDLAGILARAEEALGPLPLEPAARETLLDMAEGDGRALLTLAEEAATLGPGPVSAKALAARLTRRAPVYDKSGDQHYGLISALHKSVRGSDPDAALYWLARMLEGGEDPRYLARRITRMAAEDIGLAEPDAVAHCLTAWQCYERLGSPEGDLALAEAVVHLALAPKSNAVYSAWKAARAEAGRTGHLQPPAHILNAPTRLMKEQGFGAGYAYDHNAEDGFSGQNYFPDAMEERPRYYWPTDRGHEGELGRRLAWLAERRQARAREAGEDQLDCKGGEA
ncbi:MAG: replication-associated recombination protein A [Pseudomonadota bacterium]